MGDEISTYCIGRIKRFNEKLLDTRNEEIIKKSKEVVEQLVSFINMAVRNEKNIYVEYD